MPRIDRSGAFCFTIVCLSVCLFFYLSIHLSIYLSVCPFKSLPQNVTFLHWGICISHLFSLHTSRYGSMGSLFLDEDFLRSLNSRYNTSSSLNTTGTKEYISFIGPIGASPRSAINGEYRYYYLEMP